MYDINKVEKQTKVINVILKILNILIYIIIIPLVIYNSVILVKKYINTQQTPDFFGYKNFVIVSGSMQDTININDLVVIKVANQNELNVGDIISFKKDGIVTTHRINEIVQEDGETRYVTKGDNNNTVDNEKVIFNEVEGKYQFKISGIGNLADLLQSNIAVIVLVVIIVVNYYLARKREDKSMERKEKRMKRKQQM